MRRKTKKNVCLILAVTMMFGTVLSGNIVSATEENNNETGMVKIKLSVDSGESTKKNVAKNIQLTAQNEISKQVCLNLYLKNEDGTVATDIETWNLLTKDQLAEESTQTTTEQTLKDSVTLSDGTKMTPDAEWKEDKEENGTITSRYLQIMIPAEASLNFDVQLQYRTDEEVYTKKVLVEAKAFEEEQDVTEAAKREDESKENEAIIVWESESVSQPDCEAANPDADEADDVSVMAENTETGVTIYFAAPKEWTDNGYTIKANGQVQSDQNNWKSVEMQDTGNVYENKKVYKADTSTPYGGYYTLQFQAYSGNQWKEQIVAINTEWTSTSEINNCIYTDGTGWETYNPRNFEGDTYSVYYDATLSKMSYKGTNDVKNDGKGIPYSDTDSIYYYATNGSSSVKGVMQKASKEQYTNVYQADLPEGYNQVRFAAYAVADTNVAANGDATDLLTIPTELENPCYYGDSSDDVIYKGGNRGGYWEEAYTVRNPEKEAEQNDRNAVVDIKQSEFTRDTNTLYVNSTFYDYYTDYELNGKNRDDYDDYNPVAGSQRSYVTFRQFNQVLSDYYKKETVSIPIYTGHFQPVYSNWGNPFSAISDTLQLYGYDKNNQNGFMSTNNSTLNVNGKSTYYDAAAQGLVSNTLDSQNNLLTSKNEDLEPHFNEDFLTGNNSKHTVLGKVYENVSFPFTKKNLDDNGNINENGVEYWYFDSADTTLAMREDTTTGNYYLQDTGKQDWSKNVNSSSQTTGVSNTYGFFPFNETSASCKASKYNYGFGTKLEFKFQLTKDGTVLGKDNKNHPITFNFSGDDDVWVYVDGELALDVGGAHGKVTGQIDFSGTDSKKKATVSRTKSSQGSDNEGNNVTSTFNLKGSNTEVHTLTMFYMERGMWESNMKVSFNFPDENEFAVEKKVDTTDVNSELFPSALFEDASVFPFTIQNQATHYESKEADSSDAKTPKIYNDTFTGKVSSASAQNTFEAVGEKEGQKDVVHWKARFDDVPGKYKDQRVGIIQPVDGETFDASDTNAFLQFKMYYDYPDIPGLASTYLELEDASGQKINGYLSGKTYGTSSLDMKKWNTIQVDLSKLQGSKSFDYSRIKYIKFNYNYERDIYLDDFKFIPSVVATAKTGFVTKQSEIPDYGSVESGTLMYPTGAQYKLSKNDGTSKLYRIDSDGRFALADGETATFSDQFRRGSYIAVSEEVNSMVFDTTWTLYENGQAVSTMETGNTVENESPLPSVSEVQGDTIRDGRKEKYQNGTDGDGKEVSNKGYTSTQYAKNQDAEKTENKDTIVFRSYTNPDNQTTMTKLKATFVNKVKTGKIVIYKKAASGSDELSGDYTFHIEFSNIADLSLESEPIARDYTIKAGESVIIDGIPAGTDYRISEIKSSDGSTLENVIVKNNNTFDAGYDPVTKVVAGKVIASKDIADSDIVQNKDTTDTATIITFNNTLKPTINLNLEKKWENTENVTIPEFIKLRLQRSKDNGSTWENVKYDGVKETITLYPDYEGEWKYSFENLDQYVDYKADPKVPYLYRIAEVSGEDGNEQIIEEGGYLNDKFKVSYSQNMIVRQFFRGIKIRHTQ